MSHASLESAITAAWETRDTLNADTRGPVRDAVEVDGTELYVSSSIGVSVNDRPGTTAADLLRDAYRVVAPAGVAARLTG